LAGVTPFKTINLDQAVARAQRNVEQSLVGHLGLDPNSITGQAVNGAVSFASGTSRVAGNLLTLPLDVLSGLAQGSVPNDVIDAYSRYTERQNNPNPDPTAISTDSPEQAAADLALLNGTAQGDSGEAGAPQTYLARLQSADKVRQMAKAVDDQFNIDRTVDTTRRDVFSDDLKAATANGVADLRQAAHDWNYGDTPGETASALKNGIFGTARTVGNALATIATHPAAIAEYTAENIPQLAMAAKSATAMALSNAGYGFDNYRQGITDYQKENDGMQPTSADRLKMGLFSASAALAENVGESNLVKGLMGHSSSNIVKAVGKGAATEGATETYQSYAEGQGSLQPASLESIVEGGTIGAAVGGTIHAVGHGNHGEATAQVEQNKAVEDAFSKAVETGDVTPLTDTTSPTYAPERAVQALHAAVLAPDATEEVKQASLKQADVIQADLHQQIKDIKDTQTLYSPDMQANMQEKIAEKQDLLKTAPADEQVTLQQQIRSYENTLDTARNYDPAADNAKLEQLTQQQEATSAAVQQLHIDASPETGQVESLVSQVNAPAAEDNKAAAEQLMTLTMSNPESLSPEHINSLLDNPDNQLTPEQRDSLRAFNEAQVATNTLKSKDAVSTDIFTGGEGFKGLDEYRSRFRTAMSTGNPALAQSEVTQLQAFAASREQKAQVLADAYNQVKGTADSLQVVKTDNGWEIQPPTMSKRQLRANGGLFVDRTTFAIRDAVQLEAKALSKTADSMASLLPSIKAAAPVTQASAPATTSADTQLRSYISTPVTTDTATQATSEQAPVSDNAAPVSDNLSTPVTPEAAAEPAKEDGTLDVIKNTPKVEDTGVAPGEYTKGSMIGKFFTQQAKGAKDATARPLVAMKDFISKLKNDRAVAQLFMEDRAPLSPAQEQAVQGFLQFAAKAFPHIEKNVSRKLKGEQYQWQDYAQQLLQADGTLPQNVKTAIAYSMFAQVNDMAGDLFNDARAINTILGLPSDTIPSRAAYALLSTIGTTEAIAAASLGQTIVQASGFKAVKGAPVNEKARLETALGFLAMNSLVTMGVGEKVRVSDAKMQAAKGRVSDPNEPVQLNRDTTFFRLKASRNADNKLVVSDQAQAVREASKGTQGALDKLFSVQSRSTEPSLKPIPFTQDKAKRTQQGISSTQSQLLDKVAKRKHVLKQNMWQVWGQLSNQARYAMAGVVNEDPVHVVNQQSTQAKNDALMQEVDNAQDWFSNTLGKTKNALDTAFYFMPSVWSNYRVGLAQNVINPQTSKVHRYLIKQQGWDTPIKLDDPASFLHFQLRVLEGFGVKTEGNKTSAVISDAKDGWQAQLAKPEIKAAVDELVKSLNGEQLNESVVVAGVKAGGEGFHSLAALTALAEMQMATESGQRTFTTDLPGEVDGVNNGPQLSMLYTGTSSEAIMAQGGFFTNDQHAQFSDYKAVPGNHDMYQGLMAKILTQMDPKYRDARVALEGVIGELADAAGNIKKAGRNIVKTPLTAVMFGSGIGRAVASMQETFIENLYSKIEQVAGLPFAQQQAAMGDLVGHLNTLIKTGDPKAALLHPKSSVDQMMTTELSKQQTQAISQAFLHVIGQAATNTMKNEFGVFIERRDTINKTATRAYRLYALAESILRQQILEAAGNTTTRVREGKTDFLHDLTATQQAELDAQLNNVAPIMHTALSLMSGERNTGMMLAKTKNTSSNDTAYSSELDFGQKIPQVDDKGVALKDTQSTKSGGTRRVLAEPGVGTMSRGIHSTDSANAVLTYGEHPAINIHDAVLTGIGHLASAAQAFNKNTFNVMLNYSPAHEVQKTFEQTLIGFAELMQDKEFAKLAAPHLEEVFTDYNRKGEGFTTLPSSQLQQIRGTALAADHNKFSSMASMTSVGQYATEGGSYAVTEADRAAALKAQEKLVNRSNPQADSAMEVLEDHVEPQALDVQKTALAQGSIETATAATGLNALVSIKDSVSETMQQDIAQVSQTMLEQNIPLGQAIQVLDPVSQTNLREAVQENARAQQSVWGEVGKPRFESDPVLEALVSRVGMTSHQLIDNLILHLDSVLPKAQAQFHKELLQNVRSVTRDIPVTYVTPHTGPEGAMGEGVDKSRGWFAQRGTVQGLYIKSSDFVESGITAELLTHELVHAALSGTVQTELNRAQRNPNYSSDALSLVRDLQALQAKAQQLVQANGALSAKYANATSNVHELISWGLTNQSFQTEVLKQISVPASVGNRLLNGVQAFVQKITGLLFKGSPKSVNQRQATGMGLLLANTAGLFKAAAERRDTANREQTFKYEDAMDSVQGMTTDQVYSALADSPSGNKVTDPHHDNVLRTVLSNIVSKIYGPHGAFHEQAQANVAMTASDVFLKSLDTGKLPFASAALASSFIISEQEAYVLEQVEATTQYAMTSKETLFVRSALEGLFQQAKAKVQARDFYAGDWSQASDQAKATAQAKHDFLFKATSNADGTSSYLARFAALGLASQEVSKVLQFGTSSTQTALSSLSIGGKIIELFNRLLAKIAQINTRTYTGQQANSQLGQLVSQLVDIEAKRKTRMQEAKLNTLDKLEGFIDGGLKYKRRTGRSAIADSTLFKVASSPLIQAVGHATTILARSRVGEVMDRISLIRDNAMKGRQGIAMGVINEIQGVTDSKRAAKELLDGAKFIEQGRQHTNDYSVDAVNGSFRNGSQDLSGVERTALTRTFLRTNAHALLDRFDMTRVTALLNDPVQMRQEREALEQQVKALGSNANYYLVQTKHLAYHRVIGGSTSAMQMQSAENIAQLVGTHLHGSVSDTQAKAAADLLRPLMAMYALNYTDAAQKAPALKVLRQETGREGGANGVEYLLLQHKALLKDAKSSVFNGNEALFADGFVPEIHDPKIEVVAAHTPETIAYLQKSGFATPPTGGKVQQDPHVQGHPDTVLLTRRGSGQADILTGAVSYTNLHAKGTPVERHDGAINLLGGSMGANQATVNHILVARDAEIRAMFTTDGLTFDPRKQQTGRAVPLLRPDGSVADFRYTMTEDNRDALLDRNNDMAKLIGALAASTVDKVNSTQQNRDVVRTLREQYREDYANRPSSYIKVGRDSTDARLREQYHLLSDDIRAEIKRIWKSDNMMIPADQLDMIMGYRKYSLTEAFKNVKGSKAEVYADWHAGEFNDRNLSEKLMIGVTTALWGEKAGWRVGKAEDAIQEIMKATKDILVIKSITTMIGNIKSNLSLLLAYGVPLNKLIANHAVAIKGALDYRKDNKRLMQLEMAVNGGYVPQGQANVEEEMVMLRDRIARNPVKDLIDAGLMPTIVEDVDAMDNQYSYKSRLTKAIDDRTQWVPGLAKTVVKEGLLFTHDSMAYKFLSQSTQLSDFVARYTLYEHLISRPTDTLSSVDAMRRAEDAFINYDIPSHRSIQYMNDMGLLMFTKYYLRIQKVIAQLFKEKPTRVLATVMYGHYVQGASVVTDSSWLHRIGHNPLGNSILGAPAVIDELPGVKGLLNVL
jgi:CBS domain-containing protein